MLHLIKGHLSKLRTELFGRSGVLIRQGLLHMYLKYTNTVMYFILYMSQTGALIHTKTLGLNWDTYRLNKIHVHVIT